MEASVLRHHLFPILAGFTALVIIGWVPAVYVFEPVQFAVLTPAAHVGIKAASAVSTLFAALVLLVLPKAKYGRSIRWIAGGFIILGVGSVVFGSFPYAFDYPIDPYEAILGSLFVSLVVSVFFCIGLLSENPPRLTWGLLLSTIALVLLFKILTFTQLHSFPPLWNYSDASIGSLTVNDPLQNVTGWYWFFMSVPLVAGLASVVAALVQFRHRKMPGWLLVSFVVWAGAQLHNIVSPSTYSLVVTTTDVLRFMFAAMILFAGILALHRSAQQYARLLATEQQIYRQLAQAASLKNDFTSMLAHELGSPVAAIRRLSEIAETGHLADVQRRALQAIRSETDALRKLVADMQAIAIIESDDFTVNARPVPIKTLTDEAEAYGVTLGGEHPFKVCSQFEGRVLADPIRIGQVLRNLLSNAANYSPPGAPIELRIRTNGHDVTFEVVDQGFGIEPSEFHRIFEKFERAGHAGNELRPDGGVGLGLYLSQQIVRAHGSEISVDSSPTKGSTFRFTLEISS